MISNSITGSSCGLFEVSEVIELRIHQEAPQKQKQVREG